MENITSTVNEWSKYLEVTNINIILHIYVAYFVLILSRFRTVHNLGKGAQAAGCSIVQAVERYSEGLGFESRLGSTFSSPCDLNITKINY
jgi:hypothetical protein